MSPATVDLRVFHKPRAVMEKCEHSDHHTVPDCPGPRLVNLCSACDDVWPCDVANVLAELDTVQALRGHERYLLAKARDLLPHDGIGAEIDRCLHPPRPAPRNPATGIPGQTTPVDGAEKA